MAMKHITLPNCPVCQMHDEAVGNPNTGKFYCFHCGSKGKYTLEFSDIVEGPGAGHDEQDSSGAAKS
jgi:hypothetical protein